jgi:hypothetical protein
MLEVYRHLGLVILRKNGVENVTSLGLSMLLGPESFHEGEQPRGILLARGCGPSQFL